MHAIFPISEEKIKNHIGQKICAVLRDGTCFYGTLSSIREGELVFIDYCPGEAQIAAQQPDPIGTAACERQPVTQLQFMKKGLGDLAAVPLTVVSTVLTSVSVRIAIDPNPT